VTPSLLLSRLKLWRCTQVGARVQVLGSVYVVGGGHVEIGDDVVFDGRVVPVELHAGPAGRLIIGHGSVLEGGVSIEAQQRVEIGPGCRLRAFSKVMDNNFHPVAGSRHRRPASQPVKLEGGVEVGERTIVLPGAFLEAKVTLGPGVVIARRVRSGSTVLAQKPIEPRAVDQAVDPVPETIEAGIARPRPARLRTTELAAALVVAS
jgi:UDP-3-O-[3-hydroxymyristoyl] glucosamine N-acyltransferase